MYKNLNPASLGVSGRQSELIELTLTYGFKGFDIDLEVLAKRTDSQGAEHSLRYLRSAGLKIGSFELPLRLQADESEFKAGLAELSGPIETAKAVGARRCFTTVLPADDNLPYHENFEMHRTRLAEAGERLAQHDILLGVGFQADAGNRQGKQYQFLHKADELLQLIKAVGTTNVGLALDTWHWVVGGGGIDQLRELTAAEIVLVRLADVPAEVDVADVEPQQRLLPGSSDMFDSTGLVSLLSEIGYEGPVTVFPHPGQFSGMTREAIVQQVSSVMDELWAGAGLGKAVRVPVGAE